MAIRIGQIKKILQKTLVGFLVVLAVFLAGIIYMLSVAAKSPELDLSSVEPEGYMTTVLDDQQNVILTMAGSEANRVYVKLDQVPDQLQRAFISIEDSRFYTHDGVDPKGILRAIWTGISTFHFSQGASTITQQLLKNNVFTNWPEEKSFLEKLNRKIQEQYLAIRLERQLRAVMTRQEGKAWILEKYLNTINLGSGTWGVEAASYRYFNKDVSELTLSECAVIAGIARSPEGYNPLEHPDACRERQQQVLKAMWNQGYISRTEYEEALTEDVIAGIADTYNENSSGFLTYFEDALVQSVCQDLMDQYGYSEDDAWNLIYRGGLTIYSTQNSDIQRICEEAVNDEELYSGDAQESVVVTSVEDGSVKGIVGGRGTKDASLTLNRASNSIRQPGSTIKIIGEYAAALDTGLVTLATTVDDRPVTYSDGTEIHNSGGTYGGATTVRKAITLSVNTVAYEIFEEVGMDTVLSYLQSFGISTLTESDAVEPLALGGTYGGVTNLEMTAAYNAIACDGIYRKPYYYYRVLDKNGKEILSNEQVSEVKSNLEDDNASEADAADDDGNDLTHRVVSVETAELLTKAMQNTMMNGTGSSVYYDDGYSIAGKTGTTADCRDLWMIGFSPYFTCGVWGGYDNNEEQTEDTSYVKYVWQSIMMQINAGDIISGSDRSPYFTDDGDLVTVRVCSKCGKLAVDGLCDYTVQGKKAYTETFKRGTEPTTSCDCHEAVRICTVSGKLAGTNCPEDSVETRVYLKTATDGTDDAGYTMASAPTETCDVH